MKSYFLISSSPADFVQCGATTPVYDAAQRVWILGNGNKHSAPDGYYTLIDDTASSPMVLAAMKDQLKALVTALRFDKETAGVDVNGGRIRTDRESQATISGAKVFMDLNPDAIIDWKTETGWIKLDKTATYTVASAVGVYVQAIFSAEKVHIAAIDALSSLADTANYDIQSGWPG